jgi:hypothetical protein
MLVFDQAAAPVPEIMDGSLYQSKQGISTQELSVYLRYSDQQNSDV